MKWFIAPIIPIAILLFSKVVYELILSLFPLSKVDAGFLTFAMTALTSGIMMIVGLFDEINER